VVELSSRTVGDKACVCDAERSKGRVGGRERELTVDIRIDLAIVNHQSQTPPRATAAFNGRGRQRFVCRSKLKKPRPG
jgi:hypothetical protein